MAWVLIIMRLIAVIPPIIKLVQEIIAFIKQLPKSEQAPARLRLKSLVQALRAEGLTPRAVGDLHIFRTEMKMKAEAFK